MKHSRSLNNPSASTNSSISTPAPTLSSSARSSSPTDTARPDRSTDRVAARAYEIWEKEGRQDGRAQDHWYQAEREIEDPAQE